ncbi:MAG: helix-turn-helix domain-containing protein [Bacteroidia bacterium]|jgi:excisionase family DNA binding protein|nr:helix-turn-helix domain-containing protein [Bacteroidia bacterium]
MENLVFTQLSVQEVRNMLREEVKKALKESPQLQGNQLPEYLTIQELSEMINLAVPSIYGMVHRKQIPYVKRGKKLIFEKSQIEEWLKNGRHKTKQEIDIEAAEHVQRRR